MPDSGLTTRGPARVTVEIPADEALVHVARLAASGVAAYAGLTLDALEDIKLAVSEACCERIEAGAAVAWLRVTFSVAGDEIAIDVEGDESEGPGASPESDEAAYALALMEALTDGVERRFAEDGRTVLRLTCRVAAPSSLADDEDALDGPE
jgi:serine/threonine-protein kinase RsbW